jgi:hypothetical protein
MAAVKGEKYGWSSKEDSSKNDAWAQFERSFKIKLTEQTRSLGHVLDPTAFESKIQKVAPKMEIPDETDFQSIADIEMFKLRREEFNTERKAAKDHNKNVKAAYEKAYSLLQDMFEGKSNAAACITGAVLATDTHKERFYKALEALKTTFEPSGMADAMALRLELTNLVDTGRTHADWEAQFQRISNQLYMLGKLPEVEEMDQIVMNNISNPHLELCMTKLMLDITEEDSLRVREYTHVEFRKDASRLAKAKTSINDWGTTVRKVLYTARGGARNGAETQRETLLTCWKCGGNHLKRDCTANECTKCHFKLYDVDGNSVGHNALNCLKTPGGAKGYFSKGGDSKGKVRSAAPVDKNKPQRVPLPDPQNYSARTLRTYVARANAIIAKRHEEAALPSKKRKAMKDWEAEDEA